MGDIRTSIENLGLVEGQRYRGQCPSCHRSNTFTAEKKNGRVVYNCYSIHCSLSGAREVGLVLDDIRTGRKYEKVSFRSSSVFVEEKPTPFTLPESFVDVSYSVEAVAWLQRFNCWEAVQEGSVEVRYDLLRNRVVFLITRDGVCYGASGRSLDSGSLYKWYNYSNSPYIFYAHNSRENTRRSVALVEDCASGCSVVRVCNAYSLLGTNLTQFTIKEIVDKGFEIVYIGLDPDARGKQLKLLSQLRPFVNAKIVNFPDDPKYLTKEQIDEVLSR